MATDPVKQPTVEPATTRQTSYDCMDSPRACCAFSEIGTNQLAVLMVPMLEV
jgi:hypothetical protein